MSGYWLQILTITGINAISALGLYVTMMTGQLSVATAALMGIGAYLSGIATLKWGLPLAVAALIALTAVTILSIGFALLANRLQAFFLAIATLGLGEAAVVLAINTDYVGGAMSFTGMQLKTTPPMVFAVLAIVVGVVWRLQDSRLGMAFRAIREDELVANCIGVNVKGLRVFSFALGGLIASAAGVLYAHYLLVISPQDLGFAHSLNYLIFVAFGGSHIFWGPLLGAFMLTTLPEVLRFSVYDRYLIYGALLILVMVFRPGGLLVRRPYRGLGGSNPAIAKPTKEGAA